MQKLIHKLLKCFTNCELQTTNSNPDSEDINGNEMIHNVTLNDYGKVCNLVLYNISSTISN